MSYARRVALNTIVQMIGRVATTATSLLMTSLLNAGLNPEGWGRYVAITNYLGLFAVLADMGVNTLYLREVSRYPERTEKITAEFMGFRIFTAALVLSIAPILALFLPVYSDLATGIWVTSLGQFFLILNQIFVSTFQVNLQMQKAVLTDLAGRLVILLGIVWLFRSGMGEDRLVEVLWVVVLGNLINTLLSYFLARRKLKIGVAFQMTAWPSLFLQVMPIGAMAVLGLIHFKADSFILTLTRPTVEVGIYGNAYKIVEILITLPGMFVGGLFPAMNQAVLRDKEELKILVQKAFDLLVFAVLPLILGVILFAPLIIAIITRDNIEGASVALRILALAMLPWFIGNLTGNALLALEKQGSLSKIEVFGVTVNIVLNLLIIPLFSFKGAAAVTVVSESVVTICTFWLLARLLNFRPSLKPLTGTILVTLGLAVLYSFASQFLPIGAWLETYFTWPRLWQAGATLLVSLGFIGLFVFPLWLWRGFPTILQDRLGFLYARK